MYKSLCLTIKESKALQKQEKNKKRQRVELRLEFSPCDSLSLPHRNYNLDATHPRE